MKKIVYQGANCHVIIKDIAKPESFQLQKIREDFVSGSGALLKLFDNGKEINALIVSPNPEFGVYLQCLENSGDPKNHQTYLSLYDASKLEETIETFDEIYASKGLFLPLELAWDAVCDFITSGERSSKILWIAPHDIPEKGNW